MENKIFKIKSDSNEQFISIDHCSISSNSKRLRKLTDFFAIEQNYMITEKPRSIEFQRMREENESIAQDESIFPEENIRFSKQQIYSNLILKYNRIPKKVSEIEII